MIEGKLLKRTELNLSRLMDSLYDYPQVFNVTSDWPGDFPGRTLLALTSLYKAFEGREEKRKEIKERIEHLIAHLPEFTNEDKYFGKPFNPNYINEQQLSGNSWYIRGLCRYYEVSKDPLAIEYLKAITKGLLLPLSPLYETYPIEERVFEGGVAGHVLEDKEHNWLLSSDVGCAFILLDGYVSCYEIIKDEKLKEAIEFIIDHYARLDFVSLKCQTHATCTCARAIMRFYLITKEEKYLELAKRIFDAYVQYGMTDDYENINWFSKLDSWTEPCCVIDSFILAKQLYLILHEVKYLKLFNRIYLNGFRTFQRINGGAGCTTVVKGEQRLMKSWLYEAFFCCTLREGEGLYELSNALVKEENKYNLLMPQSFKNDDVEINIDLYEERVFEIKFLKPGKIDIYVPDGFTSAHKVKDNILSLESDAPKTINVVFDLEINTANNAYLLGDMLLSKKRRHVTSVFNIDNRSYSYIFDSSLFEKEELEKLEQEL